MKLFSFKSPSLKSLSLKSLPLQSIKLPFNLQKLPFNLKRREKIALSVAGVVLGILILTQLIIFPILNRRDRLEKQIVTRTKQLEEMYQLKAEYESLTKNQVSNEAQLKSRSPGFTLFSFLDTLAGQSGIKQNIIYMKPSTTNLKGSTFTLSIVEMKIDSLTMNQLVTFLHGVETSPNLVWIKRISLSKGEKNNQLINSILQVETYQL
ncbi:MAG: type II secretion system protein GspM [Desulfobacteraceae bacterium]|nr:type II secretion system protein GspM [Desulfobacteraceae bacterium]